MTGGTGLIRNFTELNCAPLRGSLRLSAALRSFRVDTFFRSKCTKHKKRGPQWTPFFMFGAPDTIRTCDPLVRSQVLYPAELRVHVSLPFLHPLDHILVSGPTLSSAATGACFFYFSPPTPST